MFKQQNFHKTPNPNSPCYDCQDSGIYCMHCAHYKHLLTNFDISLVETEVVYEEPVAKSNLPRPEQIVLTTAFNNLLQNTAKSELLNNYVKPTVQEQVATTVEPEVTRQIQTTIQPAVKAAVRQTIVEAADSTNEQILAAVKEIADKFSSPLPVFTV